MHPAKSLAAVFLLSLSTLAAYAETASTLTDSQKIDSLMERSNRLERTLKNDPLEGKTFGVEFNFLRALMITEQVSVSGGVSLFNVDRHAEIAFPFMYSKSKSQDIDGAWADSLSDVDFTEFTQDVHYRYFLGNTQNGFYLSGFARGAWLSGIKGESVFDVFDSTANRGNVRDNEMKLGVGVGLGFRKFSYKGLYWGASLNLGRYVLGESDKFRGGFLTLDNDSEFIFDVELLKFGWAF
jgi:hypothetical protein